jgi:hypothetical protein
MNELSEILGLNTIAKVKVINNEIIVNSYDKEFRKNLTNKEEDIEHYFLSLKGSQVGYINSDVFGFEDVKVQVINYEHYTIHDFMVKTIEKTLETLAGFCKKEDATLFIHSNYNSQIKTLTVSTGIEDDIPVVLFELSKHQSKSKN